MTFVTHFAVTAYDLAADGTLVSVRTIDCRSAAVAVRIAGRLARTHAGAMAWSRSADLPMEDFGRCNVIASYGEVPGREGLGCDRASSIS